MQEHGYTIEDRQQWDPFAAAPTQFNPLTREQRERIAQTWQFDTSNPKVDTTPLSPDITQSTASLHNIETEVHRVTKVSRCTLQGEPPRTDAFARVSVAFKQLIYTIANLAMDKLGLVTELVELKDSSKEYCGHRTPYLQRSADPPEGG